MDLIDGEDIRQILPRHVARTDRDLSPGIDPVSDRKNIRYGRPDAALDKLMQAARAAQVDHFVGRLKDGYQTIVGPRGATLSGERQRVAIARAIVRNPPILLLENEQLVMEALECLMQGKRPLRSATS